MPSRRIMDWLHRVGYLASGILLVEISGLGAFTIVRWANQDITATVAVHAVGFRSGPLTGRPIGDDLTLLEADRLLFRLPPLAVLGPNAVRFVAMPSFGRRSIALSLSLDKQVANGVLLSFEPVEVGDFGAGRRQRFTMPAAAFRAMVARLDQAAKSANHEVIEKAGESRSVELDGTPVAFERIRGGTVTSGIANGDYAELRSAMRRDLAPFVSDLAALNDDWMEPL